MTNNHIYHRRYASRPKHRRKTSKWRPILPDAPPIQVIRSLFDAVKEGLGWLVWGFAPLIAPFCAPIWRFLPLLVVIRNGNRSHAPRITPQARPPNQHPCLKSPPAICIENRILFAYWREYVKKIAKSLHTNKPIRRGIGTQHPPDT